jgi:hypothetical protein
VVGNPLPKTGKGCAAASSQFGGATEKTAANPYSTFHKSVFFKISMQSYVFMYLEEIFRSRILKFGLISQKPPRKLA